MRITKFEPSRRQFSSAIAAALAASRMPTLPAGAEKAYQPALVGKDYGKSEMDYGDFQRLPSGLLFKDAKLGNGKAPSSGDRCVVEWSGYTIGYFGRPFETKKLAELDGIDKAYYRFELGRGSVIRGLEEGIATMSEGGIRQIVIPYTNSLSYPPDDPSHERVGPRPSTFSGQRALNFVLENRELIDKTLLFNVKLIRVDAIGQNGWKVTKQS
mmetsp:Transcript_64523/g.127464  ORF Transcript_64523/g.127464 Transcript_64523/m.127464 type:complete len:213 (-) Transcript_64523:241-879(-)